MAIPSPLEPNPQSRMMSFSPNLPGLTTGNPTIDMLMSLLMGNTAAPRPIAGQSIYESFLQKNRSYEFLNTMNQGLNQMPLIRKLGGFDMDSTMGQFIGPYISRPGGFADNPLMRAMNAGNPIAAQMSMLSRGTGLTAANMTGDFRNVSVADTTKMMEGLNAALFNRRTVTQADADITKLDIDDRIRSKVSRRITDLAGGKDQEITATMQDLKNQLTRDANAAKLGLFDAKGKFSFEKFSALERQAGEIDTQKLQGATDETINALKQLSTKIKDKTLDIVQPLENAKREIQAKVGKEQIIQGVNAQISRGFETQDLSKTMMMGVDLGLIDYRKDFQKNLTALRTQRPDLATDELRSEAHRLTTQTTMGNLGKVMRAGSDLFGTQTAAETMTMVNELFGTSNLNFNNEKDANYATDLLRRISSTARVAGISTAEIMRAHGTNIAAAASQPGGLGYTRGAETMEDTLSTIKESHLIAANMGSARIRELGGMSKFLQDEISSKAAVKAQSSRLMGMLAYIDNNPDLSEERRKDLREKLISASRNQTMDVPGLMRLTKDLATSAGGAFNAAQLQQAQTNESLINQGFKINEQFKANKQSAIDADQVMTNFYDARMRIDIRDKLTSRGVISVKDLNAQGEVVNRDLTNTDEVMAYYNSLFDSDKASKLGLGTDESMYAFRALGLSNASTERMFGRGGGQRAQQFFAAKRRNAMLNTPEGRRRLAEMQNEIQTQAGAEENMARNFAHLQQPLGQSIAQLLVNGQFSEGVGPLMRMLQSPAALSTTEATSQAVQRMNMLNNAQSRTATFLTTTGGLSDADFEGQLQQLNYSPAQIAAIKAQRNAYVNDKAGLAALNAVAANGQITTAELRGYAGLSAADYAAQGLAGKTGLSYEQIVAANQFSQNTGLLNDAAFSKFKNLKLDEKTMSRIYQDYAAYRTIELGKNNALAPETLSQNLDVLNTALKNADPNLKQTIAQHLGKDGKIDILKVGRAFADRGQLSGSVVSGMESLGLMNNQGVLDTAKYLDALNNGVGEKADLLRQAAMQSGLVTYGANGYSMTDANAEKQRERLSNYYGMQDLAKAGLSETGAQSTAFSTLGQLGETITKIQQIVDQAQNATQTGENVAPLVDLKKAIEEGIGNLSTVIGNLATKLDGLLTIK